MTERKPELVLASGSPRRRELLERFGYPFKIIPARGEERPPEGLTPGETVIALAEQKAREVAALCTGTAVVVGADTVVERDGVLLGKPRTEQEAYDMLLSLSGRSHRVFTGLCVISGERVLTGYEETAVHFRPLTPEEIRAYVATGEPMDKAGAYACQGVGALFVEKLEGDFFNVMGLPLCRLGRLLKKVDVELL